jgi:hypothetical protein
MATRDEVRTAIVKEGSQSAAARSLGVSRQYVNQCLKDLPSRKPIYAANRAKGLCSCGRKPRPGYKTCKKCAAYGEKVRKKYQRYARVHGCTIAEAMIATRTRKWRKGEK